MGPIDFDSLDALAARERRAFLEADPFPHAVFDDFLPIETAAAVHAEFEPTESGWKHYRHANERKFALTDVARMPPATRALVEAFQSERFVRFVEALTGIEPLLADPDLDGGGMHGSTRGGFLNLHTDFLSHTKNRTWSRQVNLLLYLNANWKEGWGGELELWDRELTRCGRKVEPVLNRCVVFHTSASSVHGHPAPLACPEGVWRKSLALYYFREEGAPLALSPTEYRGRPEDSPLKKAVIRADGAALRVYSFLKRYTAIDDRWISRILRRF